MSFELKPQKPAKRVEEASISLLKASRKGPGWRFDRALRQHGPAK